MVIQNPKRRRVILFPVGSIVRVATCQGNVREKQNFLQVREKSWNLEKMLGNFVMSCHGICYDIFLDYYLWILGMWWDCPYRSGTVNSNTINSKFHLIRSFFEIFDRFLSFHV